MSWARVATVCLVIAALPITGCSWSTHGTTLAREGSSTGQMIYRVSEETAFTTALDAYAELYPRQGVDDVVDGSRRGYNVDENWGMDRWRHRLLVVPAVGTDAGGNDVDG